MEKIIELFEKKKKYIIIFVIGICLVHSLICIYKEISITETLLGFGISLGLFFIAWGMVFFVLGIQRINPFCNNKIFNFFCFFTLGFSLIVILYGILTDTILCITRQTSEINSLSLSPAPLGSIYGTIYLYRKNQNV